MSQYVEGPPDKDGMYRCPRARAQTEVYCSGARLGSLCCRIIPPGPCSFYVVYRNPGHWDINTEYGRAFRIRGPWSGVGPGAHTVVLDERTDDARPFSERQPMPFPSVVAAYVWCAETLMNNP